MQSELRPCVRGKGRTLTGTGRHSVRCECARGHKCVCSACGGAQHGWPGWLGLATATDDSGLARREHELRERWEQSYNPSRKRQKQSIREACIDLAVDDQVIPPGLGSSNSP